MIREELPTIRSYSRKKKIILKEVIKISTYIHFTKEQREQARRTDLANFLVSHGEKVKKSGSVNTIAGDIKLSPATVRRAIKDLKKVGLIKTEQRYREKGGKSTLLFRLKQRTDIV
ncbi:MAG: hypothetical protein ACI4I4_05370 [Acutalibacteraceae bacterium]